MLPSPMAVHKTIDDQSGLSQLTEPSDPAERERLLAEAEAEIEAGLGVPHSEAQTWLTELAAGRHAKVPCDR